MSATTLVIQSHREPLPRAWLRRCLDSVQDWAGHNRYEYRFIGDELFTPLDAELLEKTHTQRVIASDLARLVSLQSGLDEGFGRVVWCDADFLIFDPARFLLADDDFSVGREVWVQHDERQRLRSYVKVHNALLMFRRDNHFLDFYRSSAERLLRLNQGTMPPQFIGPKLLTALHNIVQCPVMESAAMLSPLVIRDCISGQGEALNLFLKKSSVVPAGANLSSSLTEREGLGDDDMNRLIDLLLTEGMSDTALT